MKRELKDNFLKHFCNSTKYSIEGLVETFKSERSFHLWAICFVITILIAIILKFSFYDYCLVFLIYGFILIVELLNTAIEHTVDLVTKEIHPLAKKAKDCGSAASLIITLIAIVLGVFVILPYLK